jgi:hypothetical protein
MSVNENAFGKIIAKAWRDPAFKAELIANPAAVLKAEGVDVPAGMTVTVVENTDRQFHLVLPPVPSDELSDEALDAVAGGNIAPKNRGHCKP